MEKALGLLLLILRLWLGWANRQKEVEQIPPSLSVQEGEDCMMNCSYTDKRTDYLTWYKKDLGKGPVPFISLVSNRDKKEGRFRASLNTTHLFSFLLITGSQLGDSATYFCAVSRAHSERTGRRSCSKTPELSALFRAWEARGNPQTQTGNWSVGDWSWEQPS
uniref:Ig-like domain-containing protein n=1 Tax=Ornithorhynchus anatinus TaxID=9258 RepID=F6ZNC0_ORNAN